MREIPCPLTKEQVVEQGKDFGDEYWDIPGGFSSEYVDGVYILVDGKAVPYTGIIYELYEDGQLEYYESEVDGITDESYGFYPDGTISGYSLLWKEYRPGFAYEFFPDGQLHSYQEDSFGVITYLEIYDTKGVLVEKQGEPEESWKKYLEKRQERAAKKREENSQ